MLSGRKGGNWRKCGGGRGVEIETAGDADGNDGIGRVDGRVDGVEDVGLEDDVPGFEEMEERLAHGIVGDAGEIGVDKDVGDILGKKRDKGLAVILADAVQHIEKRQSQLWMLLLNRHVLIQMKHDVMRNKLQV